MAEMRRSFHNVKSLLGKLDRSIDEARSRRLGDPVPSASSPSPEGADGLETVIGRSESNGSDSAANAGSRASGNGASAGSNTPAQPSPRRSMYGRAKPLRRPDGPTPTTQWSS